MDNEREYKMTADSRSQVHERGLKLAEEGLKLDAEHLQLRELHKQAEDELEKRQKIEALRVEVTDRFEAKNYEAALKVMDELLLLVPEGADELKLKVGD